MGKPYDIVTNVAWVNIICFSTICVMISQGLLFNTSYLLSGVVDWVKFNVP